MVQVTVWNEYRHERESDEVAEVYPDGIHAVVADALDERGHEVQTATLDEPEHGLTEAVLDETEVLLWWGHQAHGEVEDDVVERVVDRVHDGMGFVALHSAHMSKPFTRLMGTDCFLKWRESDDTERLWVTAPGHPIADGLDDYIELDETEMYGEHFEVPEPETTVFTSWFEGGEVFRSGLCYTRDRGRVFYFRPGHETYPIYYDEQVRTVLDNAVAWAAPAEGADVTYGNADPVE
jgi:trehalose utilization protein